MKTAQSKTKYYAATLTIFGALAANQSFAYTPSVDTIEGSEDKSYTTELKAEIAAKTYIFFDTAIMEFTDDGNDNLVATKQFCMTGNSVGGAVNFTAKGTGVSNSFGLTHSDYGSDSNITADNGLVAFTTGVEYDVSRTEITAGTPATFDLQEGSCAAEKNATVRLTVAAGNAYNMASGTWSGELTVTIKPQASTS